MSEFGVTAGLVERPYTRDPWGGTSRWYERRKRALTMAALPKARYRNAFEPGCSIGALSEELTGRCDRLVCTDLAAQALDAADRRIDRLPESARGSVEFRRWALGQSWADECFDLIVFSEVGYHLDSVALRAAFGLAVEHLDSDGTLLCVHWRRKVPEYPLSGDHVHAIARTTQGVTATAGYHDEDILLDVFTAGDPISVAASEHLV
ncbi:nodulation protein S (NodS) [Nocardia tenerifensis]|uniref:Nodulation protein S (NodS) n=1 Tax=Nocardia tenerifensis TaxID=228006 RepID=A0A318K8Y6_9NOCA|nr:SAM-dependent methyltransferase [Nocardia tenerifensis]PXX69174.1 nodulation protein S (NodS) [Nocardia tenerifensis]